MSADERVSIERDGGVVHLRLVREQARNAIDPAMVEALDRTVAAAGAEPSLRAVLISAHGPSFTVGGDLAHFAEHRDDLAGALDAIVPTFHSALQRLAGIAAPVVCAVQGAIAGGGLGLAWCADFVLAAEDARFATGFAQLGLSGDGGSSWFLPRLVGLRRAQELLLGGRVLSAQEALEWGLVTRVVAPQALEREAEALVHELAAGPTVAYAEIRRLLRSSSTSSLAEQLAAEAEAMRATGATADAREGISAFAERRSPRFAGR